MVVVAIIVVVVCVEEFGLLVKNVVVVVRPGEMYGEAYECLTCIRI